MLQIYHFRFVQAYIAPKILWSTSLPTQYIYSCPDCCKDSINGKAFRSLCLRGGRLYLLVVVADYDPYND